MVVLGCAVVAAAAASVDDVACSAPVTAIDMTVAALNPGSIILSDTRMSPAFLGSSTMLCVQDTVYGGVQVGGGTV